MGRLTVNVLEETKVPTLPSTQMVQDPAAKAFLESLRELTEVREGIIGDRLDQNVTFRDLYHNGLLNLSVDERPYIRLPGERPIFLPLPPNSESNDFAPPPAVTGLAASGALANVIITFNAPSYHNHAFTEIWRAGVDDLGLAVMVGTTEASVYADNVGTTGATRYYWARNVSQAGIPGPFNAIAGTSATTGVVLTGDIADASITTAKLADGSVTTVKYADASITTVKIGNDQVTTAKIGDAQVTTTKINNGAVTTAKIATLAVTSNELADLSVTVAKHASGLRPVEILTSLPGAGTEGRTAYLTTDDKLYRDTGVAWTAAVATTDLTGTITTTQIADDSISTPKLQANVVTTAKLAANAVTANELAANSVIAGKIAAGVVSTTELAANAVTAAKLSIQTHGVSGLTLTNNSPVAGSIAWSAFTLSWNGNTYSIGSGNTASEMVWFDRSVSTTALQATSRTTFETDYNNGDGDILIAVNSSGTAETIYNATLITGGWIKTGAIVASKIAAAAVVAGKIATNAIIAGDGVIATAAIATAQIQDAAITNAKIGDLAVDSAKIAAAAVVTAKIADANITSAKIGNLEVKTANIDSLAVTTAKIAALAVTSAEIANLTITDGKVAANTLTPGKLNILQHAVKSLTFTNNSPLAGDVTWSAHTIAWDGNTYSIVTGNSNVEMLWFDRSFSTTALRATTRTTFETDFNPSDGDILLAVNTGGTHETIYLSTQITGSHIKTGTITAGKISVTSLSAIHADMGSITAGTITLNTSGHIKSGMTAYMTGTGFWLGIDGGTAKFSIGDPSVDYFSWSGSGLEYVGSTKKYAAGTTILISATASDTVTGGTYVKYKEIQVMNPGTLTVKMTISTTLSEEPGTATTWGRIYVNGVAVGTERSVSRSTVGTSASSFSENITVKRRDLIQLYCKETADDAHATLLELQHTPAGADEIINDA